MAPSTTPEHLLALWRSLYPKDPYIHDSYLARLESLVRSEEEYLAAIKYYLEVRGDPKAAGTYSRHWSNLPGFNLQAATIGELDYKTNVDKILPELQAALDDKFNKEY